MAGDYRNFTLKLSNKGLNIVDPPDMQEEGEYSLLTNVRSGKEQELVARPGMRIIVDSGSNGASPVLNTRLMKEDSYLIAKQNGTIWNNEDRLQIELRNLATGGSAFYDFTLDHSPHTFVRAQDPSSGVIWTFVGNSAAVDPVTFNPRALNQVNMIKVRNTDAAVYQWGITAPVYMITGAQTTNAGELDSSVAGATGYDWRFTYRATQSGSESNGSKINETPLEVVDHSARLSGIFASRDPQVDQIRLWRRGGTVPTWRLVDTFANTDVVGYEDVKSDEDISFSEEIPLENDVPFTTVDTQGNSQPRTPLPYIWGPFDGNIIFGAGDPNRPGYVYWTNPGDNSSASPFNFISVVDPSQPIIGGFIYGGNPYCWTRDSLWTLDYGGPTSLPMFRPREIPIGIGMSQPWAFAVGMSYIAFLAKDGIYLTDTNTLKNITKDSLRPIFMGESIESAGEMWLPVSRGDRHSTTSTTPPQLSFIGSELHFTYTDSAEQYQHIFYDIVMDRWAKFESDLVDITSTYGEEDDPIAKLILGADNGQVFQGNVGRSDVGSLETAAVVAHARTGAWDSTIPLTMKEFGNAIVDTNPGGVAVTVTPYYNADQDAGTPVVLTGSTREAYPFTLENVYAKNISFDIQFTGPAEVYQIVLLFREDEEKLYVWHYPPTTHGMEGWKHIRDSYWMLRSTAEITFTHTVDGVAHTYTLPNTNDEKQLFYLKMDPAKGKYFEYDLTSTGQFRFYGEESYLNIKEWNTAKSYNPISPFVSSGYAPYLRKEAGT